MRCKFDGNTAIHEQETIVDENAIWIESRPVLQKGFRIGVDRGGQSMGRPAFKKNFATRDARTRFKIERGTTLSGRTPGRRTEFAKGIVLGGDTLEVKQEVTFPFANATVARRKLTGGDFNTCGWAATSALSAMVPDW